MISVNISNNEFASLNMLAKGRHFIKDNYDLDRLSEEEINKRIIEWNISQHEADLIGVIGEYCVAKYLRIPFDTSINLGGDGGNYDMFIGDWSIQVKSTKYKTGVLAFHSLDESQKSLLSVLAIVDIENKKVTIPGYIDRNKIKKIYTKKNLNHGDRIIIQQENLQDLSELKYYTAIKLLSNCF